VLDDAPVVALDDVSVAFGTKRVLDGLCLEIPRGKTTVIVGRSGSGKTVLLKLMTGLLQPDRGRVRMFGRELATLSYGELLALRARMAMLFQNYALFDSLDVEDNVVFPLVEGAQRPQREAERQAHELIEMLGLADSKHVLPGALSGGMKRRVALARALISRPEIALFDEPTTGLDPLMVEQVDELITLARRRFATTMVIISHDLASVQRLADRVAFLHEGRIIFVGSCDELVRCQLPPIREFLAAGASPARAPSVVSQSEPVIELVGVHKRLGDKHVLRGVDLAIYPNRITGLIGGSGSGKSVLVKHILGLLQPDRGRILVFGNDIVSMRDRELADVRSRFALVFQHAALLDGLSVEDNVAFPLVEHRRLPSDEVRRRVDDLVERLGLGELRRRMPGELSVGERKRVGLARAMVTRPDILIYDEATTGQDPVRAHEIEDMIVQAHEQFGITTIVISHDMPSICRIAHTIAMLHDGKIVACGTPAELRASADANVHHFLHAAGVV
jgi:ABC-type transporter Mla maintaining outer membrane lipid asymmetry ATPase subunit MlaF